MQCKACGYEKGFKWIEEDGGSSDYKEVNPGGEEFIKINGHFTTTEDHNTREVGLYACPECKTVILNDN